MSSFFLSGKLLLGMVGLENRREKERIVTCLARILWEGYKPLGHEATNLFCKSPGIKYYRLCGIDYLCHNHSALLLKHESSHRQHTNE